jgi:UDP-N-acetylmuramoyl-tripeptide--D-alanyl-D-alanine ligase
MTLTVGQITASLYDAPAAGRAVSVSTDTRTLGPGDIYIALRGETFDGHDFVADALAKGASVAIVDHVVGTASPQVVVADTLAALGQIARGYKEQYAVPRVAVTGSVGKTTTKELIASALTPLGPVLKTEKNENNEIGLPKTLLRLTDEHAAVVVEMGMRGAGQIKYLAEIAQPTIGIITTIGESHIELLGSREAIADAKAELFEAMRSGGICLFNADDDFAPRLRQAAAGKTVITFRDGTTGPAKHPVPADEPQFVLTAVDRNGDGWSATATAPSGQAISYTVNSPARHDALNALSAIAVACAAGVSPAYAAAAVGKYQPSGMRMETLAGLGGSTVLSDCYNAAPTSMRAALDTLAATNADGRKIAFLGDMKELGDHAPAMHAGVIAHAEELELNEIYVVGEEFARQAKSARVQFATSQDAAEYARTGLLLGKGDIVLVKGSRSMRMERVVDAIRDDGNPAAR